MQQRLQKIIAQAGIASRRKAEELIEQGKVAVNGTFATLGMSADPAKDKITVDGARIKLEQKVYIMLNKPQGYVSTVSEPFGMRTILSLVPVSERVFPIGRLDRDSEGLIILTNDGDLANRIMHPRYTIDKEYLVKLHAPLDDERESKLKKGLVIEGIRVVPTQFQVEEENVVRIAIHEGRKHIIRRIFERVGFRVIRLKRVRIGPLTLRGAKRGKWRYLDDDEVGALKRATGSLQNS